MSVFRSILNKLHLSEFAYSIEKFFGKPSFINKEFTAEQALTFLESQWHFEHNSSIWAHSFSVQDCDVEIIIPCYNVEKYVEECVESVLLQQTQYKYFITIVNDGSTDSTRSRIKKYEDHPNVKIIDQNNSGLSGARNAAISQAHGKYLFFIDPDDIMCEGTIETLMSLAFKYDADIVDSAHIRFADRSTNRLKNLILAKIYDAFQRPQALPPNTNSQIVNGFSCGKAIRTSLFSKVKFPSSFWHQDTITWMMLEPQCKRKVVTDKLSFKYRMNPNSISHVSKNKKKSLDSIYITLQLLKDRETLGIEFDAYQYDQLLKQMRMNFCRIINLSEQTKYAVFVIQQDLISNKFANWISDNPSTKPIELLLRSNDYEGFKLWCKWH